MLRETLPEGVVEAEYEVLNILEFNSTRKRMSVVLRAPDNRILLYCKVGGQHQQGARGGQGSGACPCCCHRCHPPLLVVAQH